MARRLFVVEDTFWIKGRGLIPVPGIVPQGDERFRVGDPIVIERPDGSRIESNISGIERILGSPPKPRSNLCIILNGLGKEDVPIGSEVWSVNS